MAYYINNKNISDFGIKISKFTGFEILPKRKGKTEHNWPDINGVEPFVDDDDIRFEARDLKLSGNLIADTIELAQSQFLEFQDWIYSSGQKQFFVDYLNRIFVVYFKDAPIGNRITNISGKVVYSLNFKIREIDPTNKIEADIIVDFDTVEFSDFDTEILYVII